MSSCVESQAVERGVRANRSALDRRPPLKGGDEGIPRFLFPIAAAAAGPPLPGSDERRPTDTDTSMEESPPFRSAAAAAAKRAASFLPPPLPRLFFPLSLLSLLEVLSSLFHKFSLLPSSLRAAIPAQVDAPSLSLLLLRRRTAAIVLIAERKKGTVHTFAGNVRCTYEDVE